MWVPKKAYGAEPYGEIASAMSEFQEDWGKEVKTLEELTRTAGAKAGAAGKLMADHDDALGQSMRIPPS